MFLLNLFFRFVQTEGSQAVSCYTSQPAFNGGGFALHSMSSLALFLLNDSIVGWEAFLDVGLDKFYIMDTNPQLADLLRGRRPFEVRVFSCKIRLC